MPQVDPAGISHDEVRAQLERVLSSSRFSSSDKLSKFLRFVVELCLNDRAGEIKEYLIASEVYGRGERYDPQVDSIVRVEASRLRAKLRDYYAGEGNGDPIVIRVPRGAYSPEFTRVAPAEQAVPAATADEPATEERSFHPRVWAAAGFGLLLVACGWMLWKRGASSSDPIRSVAILPFVNLGAGDADERFADGITEEITAQLARNSTVQVTGRTTMYQFKGRAVDIPRLGRDLSVQSVLEGSVRHENGRYLVTAQLINTGDGYHLWTQTFDRQGADSLALQKEIAESLTRDMTERMRGRAQWRSAGRGELTAAAVAAYGQGLRLLHQDHRLLRNEGRIPPNLEKAIALLEETVSRSPEFAKGWSDLAAACESAIDLEPAGSRRMHARAEEAVRRALELDPSLAEAHALTGSIRFYRDWDWEAAEKSLRRAIELNPRQAGTRKEYSDLLRLRGDPEAALREVIRAQELDPGSDSLSTQKAVLLYNAKRYDEAIEEANHALSKRPDSREAHWIIGMCWQEQGKLTEAEAKYRQVLAIAPKDGRALPALGHVLGQQGKTAAAMRVAATIRDLTQRGKGMEYPLALVYAGMGENDLAFEWLEKAYENRDPSIMFLKVSPRFAPLRSDPRFARLLKKLNL